MTATAVGNRYALQTASSEMTEQLHKTADFAESPFGEKVNIDTCTPFHTSGLVHTETCT